MGHSKNERVEFYGGELISLLPTIIYIFVAMILSLKFGFLSIENVTVGGMIGILIGFLLSKNKNIYWKTVMSGITKPGKARLLFIFALIGCFTKLLVCGEIGNGLVWISQIFNLSGGAFVLFVFISSMVIAVGSGAPIAALFAVVPLFYPPGVILGANPPVLIGAIISGIFFGDNLAPSSQVTVTTASTQTSKYTDDSVNTVTVISDRMKYILIAALISAVLFFINGGGGSLSHSAEAIGQFSNPRGLIMLIPLSVLLIICIKTKNLFKGLSYAIITGLITGLGFNLFNLTDIISISGNNLGGIFIEGINSMSSIIISCIFLFGIIEVMIQGGGIKKISNMLSNFKFTQNPGGAEMVIAFVCMGVNMLLSGAPLPAILLIGSFANDMGQKVDLAPSRRTYFIMGMMNNISVIVPFCSIFIMSSMTMVQNLNAQYQFANITLSSFSIFKCTYFCLIMTVISILWVITGWGREFENESVIQNNAQQEIM